MRKTHEQPTTHKDLDVWKEAMGLAAEVYSLTRRFPREEIYGLTLQARRSAVSIPSNIAEGAGRHSRKEFIQFLHVALGSIAELETQVILATRMSFIPDEGILDRIERVRKLLLGLLRSLKNKPITHHASPITSLS